MTNETTFQFFEDDDEENDGEKPEFGDYPVLHMESPDGETSGVVVGIPRHSEVEKFLVDFLDSIHSGTVAAMGSPQTGEVKAMIISPQIWVEIVYILEHFPIAKELLRDMPPFSPEHQKDWESMKGAFEALAETGTALHGVLPPQFTALNIEPVEDDDEKKESA